MVVAGCVIEGMSLCLDAERTVPLLSDYRLFIPDLLGFRRSPKPDSPYDLDAHCAVLAPLVVETQPSAAVGHSMGAVVALRLLQRPLRCGRTSGSLRHCPPGTFPHRSRGRCWTLPPKIQPDPSLVDFTIGRSGSLGSGVGTGYDGSVLISVNLVAAAMRATTGPSVRCTPVAAQVGH